MDLPLILQVSREIGLSGGTECVAFELHCAWLALGLDAAVVTGNLTEPEGKQGVTLTGSWLKSWGTGRLRYLATLFAIPLFTLAATLRVLRTRSPKIVLSHGDSLVGDICVIHAVNRACLAEKRRRGYYGWLVNPSNLWVGWRDWWMLRGLRYRKVVAISERVRRELKQYYGVPDERIVTIPNGINLARYGPENSITRAEVRRSFGIADDMPLVLFVGSRFRIKGLKFAIEAIARMKTTATLLVVGNDNAKPYEQLAERLGVKDRVIFAGGRSDLPRIYPAADAFVLPTLYETFALVCLEAMASGLPILASPVGGIEDYLHDGINGLHIRHDPPEIAAKLDQLLASPEMQACFRDAGLATAQKYSWEKIARQYLHLFEEVVRERSTNFQTLAPSSPRL